MIIVEFEGKYYMANTAAEIVAKGVPVETVSAGTKDTAIRELVSYGNMVRAKLASPSPGKLAEYRVKEEIANAPGSAAAAELALIDREAAARGTDQAGLLAIITAKATAFRAMALEVGAIEAEGKAAIEAVPDTAVDVDSQVQLAASAAKEQLRLALLAAEALLDSL